MHSSPAEALPRKALLESSPRHRDGLQEFSDKFGHHVCEYLRENEKR